jgi:5-hydroxyisourate hydrolase
MSELSERPAGTLSTHVLDSTTGRPAAGLAVALHELAATGWQEVGAGITDADGRLRDWGPSSFAPGTYRLTFATGPWFAELEHECFYPEAAVTFTVEGAGHYHVPLLLAPFAYSTYRGS